MSKVTKAFHLFFEQDPDTRKKMVKDLSAKDAKKLLRFCLNYISKQKSINLKDFIENEGTKKKDKENQKDSTQNQKQ